MKNDFFFIFMRLMTYVTLIPGFRFQVPGSRLCKLKLKQRLVPGSRFQVPGFGFQALPAEASAKAGSGLRVVNLELET